MWINPQFSSGLFLFIEEIINRKIVAFKYVFVTKALIWCLSSFFFIDIEKLFAHLEVIIIINPRHLQRSQCPARID